MDINELEFEFEDFHEHFTLTVDESSAVWPSISVQIAVEWQPGDSDVGETCQQPEIRGISYFIDRGDLFEAFLDDTAFGMAIYAVIADEIEEGPEDVVRAVQKYVNDWEEQLEPE